METILLAVALQRYLRFTPQALLARKIALDLALRHGSTVHALTIESIPDRHMPDTDLESSEEKLDRFVELLKEANIPVVTHVLQGVPRRLIPEHARKVGATVIVMGSHAKRTIRDVLLGGTAAAVLAEAHCPVILAAPPVSELAVIRDLTIPDKLFQL